MIKKIFLSSALALIFSPVAHAVNIDTEVFTLNVSADLTGTAGTVKLTQTEGTNTVHIDVELGTNYSFRSNSDGNHTGFTFDTSVPLTAASVTNITFNFSLDTPVPGTFAATPYGTFPYGIDCTGSLCVNGPTQGSSNDLKSLQFDVTATGLTINNFISNGQAYFVADLQEFSPRATGSIAATSAPGVTVTSTVPEPSSLALLGTGLAGLAEMIRRRMR